MAISFLLEGLRPSRVAVGCSPLAELMACLHVLTEQEHHPRQLHWARTTAAALPADLTTALRRFAPLWARYRCRFLLPLAAPLDRCLAEELDSLAALDLGVFTEHISYALAGVDLGDLGGILEDQASQRLVLRDARRRSYMREELADRLFADPEALRSELIDVLRACAAPFFDEYWARVQGHLHDASEKLLKRFADEPVALVLASLGPASRYERAPDRVIYDKLQHAVINLAVRPCLIVPSIQSFPHLLIKSEPRLPVVVHAPVSPAEDGRAPSLAEVKARLAVLNDPHRLALCRHLAGEAITTSELARRSGMSAPQVSRHIERLRSAGLVTSSRDGRFVYHRLSTDVMMQLGVDLLGAILR
jgi:DNA-binding transcriptional ArsR family regulator